MSRPAPEPTAVLALYREGADAFVCLATQAAAADAWDRPACGTWSAADLARHELNVIGWYHGWLDRALDGDASPAFDLEVIDDRTDAGVRALADVSPGDAVSRFATEAERYAARLEPNWDLPFGYPRGTVTAGLHAGMAACEWHLHAWDLAQALGTDHHPSDPAALLIAAPPRSTGVPCRRSTRPRWPRTRDRRRSATPEPAATRPPPPVGRWDGSFSVYAEV